MIKEFKYLLLTATLTLLMLPLMAQKPVVYYVFDPLCGWCYGFTPVIIDLKEKYKENFDFRIVSGGMIVGSRVHSISQMTDFISKEYKRVEQTTGVKFGEEFLSRTLHDSSVILDSELPTRAMMVFKEIQPDKEFEFTHDIQKALYWEGKNLSDKQTYFELASKYDIDGDYFVEKLKMEDYKNQAYNQFELADSLGVRGYPSIVLENAGKVELLTSGFISLGDLEKKLPTRIK